MTSQISLWRREQLTEFGYLPPENELNLKSEFLCQNNLLCSLCPESLSSTPMSISARREQFFHFPNFEKSRSQKSSSNPLTDQFCYKTKTRSYKIWAS